MECQLDIKKVKILHLIPRLCMHVCAPKLDSLTDALIVPALAHCDRAIRICSKQVDKK